MGKYTDDDLRATFVSWENMPAPDQMRFVVRSMYERLRAKPEILAALREALCAALDDLHERKGKV